MAGVTNIPYHIFPGTNKLMDICPHGIMRAFKGYKFPAMVGSVDCACCAWNKGADRKNRIVKCKHK